MRLRRSGESAVSAILARIPLTAPWTVDEFVQWLSQDTGRAVTLRTRSSAGLDRLGCGTLYVLSNELQIIYSDDRSERHQRQQIFHEIAHVLCDHRGSHVYDVPASVLTDGIDPARIIEVLHRGSFGTATEAEAELVGTALALMSRGAVCGDRWGALHRSAALMG